MTANPNAAFPKLRESALRRVARYGDGWMTTANTIDSVGEKLALVVDAVVESRTLPDDFEVCLYYNIRVDNDRDAGLIVAADYLRDYYGVDYEREFLERWVAVGEPQRCVDEIKRFIDAGVTTVTLRLIGRDETAQFERVSNEVLPALVA